MEEGEAAEPLLQRERGEALVGQRRAGADAVARLARRLTEALRRQADGDAGDAAVADEKIRADADDGDRHGRIELRQEQREIVGVGRLEQQLGRPADAEPGERRDLGVRGQPAANSGEVAEGGRCRSRRSWRALCQTA